MKFAIHKLALACVVPTSMLLGVAAHVRAQDVSAALPDTAVKSTEALTVVRPPAMVQRNTSSTTARAKRTPIATNKLAPAGGFATKVPVAPKNQRSSETVKQVAYQAPQPQQAATSQPADGGDTDVQRQLRMLYEKSGQEMPVMDLNEMVVPEPQPGVMPNGSPPGNGQPGMAQPMPQQAEVAKKPNFFERVFLGKKAPASPQQQKPQYPSSQFPRPTTAVRPPAGQPAPNAQNQGAQLKAGQPNQPNYQPYATNPQAQPNMAGQRPAANQPSATPNHQRPVPQGQPRPQALPANQAPQAGQPFLQPPQAVQNQLQSPGQTPSVQAQQQSQQLQGVGKELPVLEDEPEESLEIDLTPRTPGTAPNRAPQSAAQQPSLQAAPQQPANRAALPPVNQPRGVIPAPTLAIGAQPAPATPAQAPAVAAPTPEPTATQDENPFSGLRLSIPETAGQKPVPSTEPAAAQGSISTPQPSLATPNLSSPQTDKTVRSLPAVQPSATQQSGISAGAPHPTQTKSGARSIPAIPVSQQSTPAPSTNPFLEPPVERTTTLSLLDDNLRKLAASPEKLGYKGFCPVELRQHRMLAAVKPQFNATHLGKKFRFSSAEAKAQFEKSPELYAPAHDGIDGVALLDQDKSLEGSLDFAAWYHGRLYMFTTRENLELFNADPDQYVDEKELDAVLEKAMTNPAKQKQVPAPATPPVRPTLRTKTGTTTAPRTQGNPNSAKSPATQPAAQPGTATRARNSQANTPVKQGADDLPVLGDNLDTIEPIAPRSSTAPVTNPRTAQPNSGSPTPNLVIPNPNLNAPANTTAPSAAAPKTINSPVPKTDGANSDRPPLEGPKMQGPKLNRLAAPIKPASATETQQKYAAPRLIDPQLQHANPMLTPPSD